ncbi:hypothetical protein B5X24_HaOG201707 [Helicoverpa armigera]|nr:hypothetical protein B5X24_HaOG201707 [Helicoverpa armigera]
MVPLGPEASRHTTLGLLTKAKRFIKSARSTNKRQSGLIVSSDQRHRKLNLLLQLGPQTKGKEKGFPRFRPAPFPARHFRSPFPSPQLLS